MTRSERSVDLVGTDLDVPLDSILPTQVQQDLDCQHVRSDKRGRPHDAAVDVALVREVDDGGQAVPERVGDLNDGLDELDVKSSLLLSWMMSTDSRRTTDTSTCTRATTT